LAQILVASENAEDVAKNLTASELKHSVEVDNILHLAEQERRHMEQKRKRRSKRAGEITCSKIINGN